MSLKSFHILFVSFAMLLSLFFIFWAFVYMQEPGLLKKIIGWSGIIGIIMTPIYGIYFLKKSSKLIL